MPGESSSVPEDRRIHLEDLRLEHDEDEDRLLLRSERLGREVIPVYLGYLVPLALPETPRTLLLLSPTSMAPLDVWAGVPHGPAHEGVTRRPRVRHGNLVLARRGWSTTAAALPTRPAGTPDDEVFLAWRRWRRTHGLPGRVFVTVSSGPRGGAGAKPQYLDFDSPLSLTAFEALVKSPDDRIELREMLPAESGLHVVSERGGHVAELSVETFTSHSRFEESPA
ncbi:lantibiotic dehydratase [Streptomyces sp. MS1.AVA.1]|uniref:Lantibiotic dehydratase n=1 Tax=Streptomyces machairae TaxID=3134109 RepID=A0ABU8UFG8_9ACTN